MLEPWILMEETADYTRILGLFETEEEGVKALEHVRSCVQAMYNGVDSRYTKVVGEIVDNRFIAGDDAYSYSTDTYSLTQLSFGLYEDPMWNNENDPRNS